MISLLKHSFIIVFLSILTQIGGVIYGLALVISNLNKVKKPHPSAQLWLLFLALYLCSTFLIVPIIARLFGREPIQHVEGIRPATYLTLLLNRNYGRPELNQLLQSTAEELKNSNIQLRYLDANFPFINRFPMLPHMSHHDGKKIDLSLIYMNAKGEITTKSPSISGYGVFEPPSPSETNQPEQCKNMGYWQYDYPKYFTFGSRKHLTYSNEATKQLMQALLAQPNLEKIFIEPHLKERMNISHPKVRFHGCRAVRHDDHIHLQLK